MILEKIFFDCIAIIGLRTTPGGGRRDNYTICVEWEIHTWGTDGPWVGIIHTRKIWAKLSLMQDVWYRVKREGGGVAWGSIWLLRYLMYLFYKNRIYSMRLYDWFQVTLPLKKGVPKSFKSLLIWLLCSFKSVSYYELVSLNCAMWIQPL